MQTVWWAESSFEGMRPFVRFTALLLAILFLGGTLFAWIDILKQGNLLSNPQLISASAWLTTGLMFLALGLRGWRFRSGRSNAERPEAPTEWREGISP